MAYEGEKRKKRERREKEERKKRERREKEERKKRERREKEIPRLNPCHIFSLSNVSSSLFFIQFCIHLISDAGNEATLSDKQTCRWCQWRRRKRRKDSLSLPLNTFFFSLCLSSQKKLTGYIKFDHFSDAWNVRHALYLLFFYFFQKSRSWLSILFSASTVSVVHDTRDSNIDSGPDWFICQERAKVLSYLKDVFQNKSELMPFSFWLNTKISVCISKQGLFHFPNLVFFSSLILFTCFILPVLLTKGLFVSINASHRSI